MANSADLSVSVALTGEQQAVTAIQQINAALKINIEITQKAAEAARAESAALSSTLPSVRGVTDALGQQTAQLRAQRDAMKTDEYQKYAAQQKAIRAEIEQMTAPQQQNASGWLTMGNAVRGFMALQAVGYIKSMGSAVFDATAEMQSLRMGMTAVMKSSTLANAEMERLKETAKLPGLGYAEAIRMSTGLQAAGFSAAQARKSMEAFGNALATVGKGKADLDGVGLALTQIMSKGKVSAEEINQIAERVPQIRVAMQDAFGTASTEMIQAMGLSSGQFIRGVTEELGKLEKVTGGLKNGTENLSDAWMQFKANVGGSGSTFQSVLDILGKGLTKANNLMAESDRRYQIAMIEDAKRIKAFYQKKIDAGKTLNDEDTKSYLEARRRLAEAANAEKKAAAEALAAKTALTDGQKDLIKQASTMKKSSLAEDLKAEAAANKFRLEEAKGLREAVEAAESIHKARIAEINERWAKKEKAGPSEAAKAGPSEAAKAAQDEANDIQKRNEAVDKWNEEQEAKRVKNIQDELAIVNKLIKEAEAKKLKAIKDGLNARTQLLDLAAQDEEEIRLNAVKAEKERAKQVEDAWSSVASRTSGVWSEALMTIGTKQGDFYDTLSEGFSAMIRKMVADLVANAAIFGILSLIPGANAKGFAAGLGGLGSAILGIFDVGTRALPATGPIIAHKDEAIFPAPVSRAMHAGDWGPAMRFMGQGGNSSTTSTSSQTNHITVNVAGTNASPQAIAQAISRAIPIQQRKGARSSF